LRAFDYEISKIKDQAKTEMLLMMRYQWWKDAVKKAFSEQSTYEMQQPSMNALSNVISVSNMSKYRLLRLIGSYEQEALRSSPFQTIEELENFAEGTSSQLLYLQLEACNEADASSEHAASHLGKAFGICQLLRHLRHADDASKTYFPEDVCDKHGVSPHDLINANGENVLQDVVFEIASVAKGHLEAAQSHCYDIKPSARPLFLSSVSTEMYLNALEKNSFDVFGGKMHKGGYLPISYLLKVRFRQWRGLF